MDYRNQDAITLEHMDGDGRLRKRESAAVPFHDTNPLKNDPLASPWTTSFPAPDYFTPWYERDGG